MMKFLIVLSAVLVVSLAMKCKDCTKYCICTEESIKQLNLTHSVEDTVKAADTCLEKTESPFSEKIGVFFECRNPDCKCAPKIGKVVGIALGMEVKDKTPAKSQGETRRKRHAEKSAAYSKVKQCLAAELDCELKEVVELLERFREVQEAYLVCFEDKCHQKEKDVMDGEEQCSKDAGMHD